MAKRSRHWKERFQAWEIDWSKRRRVGSNEQVWARNPASAQARSRPWHWTTWYSLKKAGIQWKPKQVHDGKHLTPSGYVVISRGALSAEDSILVEKAGLWIGKTRGQRRGVKAHQLAALKKYGSLPPGFLVRHLNGDKEDNSPGNLVLGTRKDNSMDHRTAVLEMMYWRERALIAEGRNPARVLSKS